MLAIINFYDNRKAFLVNSLDNIGVVLELIKFRRMYMAFAQKDLEFSYLLTSLSAFQQRLKTFVFHKSFPDILL